MEEAQSMIDFYKSHQEQRLVAEATAEWEKNNMEYDLRSSELMCTKAKNSEAYAQNIYAALCNNEFRKISFENTPEVVVDLLANSNPQWSCSWRHAGGVVADMIEQGDYMDWYCSGMHGDGDFGDKVLSAEQIERLEVLKKFVSEGTVTDEIRTDLQTIGWSVIDE